MEYVITRAWDAEASVWIATSEDVPGLLALNGNAPTDIPPTQY
jgi:hypothetical protein